jgi:hypothetical protein
MTTNRRQHPDASAAQAGVGTTTDAARPEAQADTPRRRERVLTRTCRHCGKRYEPVRDHQAFCGPPCRLAHFKADAPRALPLGDPDDLFRVPFE